MIGKTISTLRKRQELTQNELAEKLHISNKTVSKWESGAGDPGIEFLLPLSELFNVSVEYLLSDKNAECRSLNFKSIGQVTKAEFCALSLGKIKKLEKVELATIPVGWLVEWSTQNKADIIYEIYHENLNGYFSDKYEEGLDILFREYNNDFLSVSAEIAFGWKNYGRFAKFRDKFIELNYLKEEYIGNRPRYSFLETDKEKLLTVLKSI